MVSGGDTFYKLTLPFEKYKYAPWAVYAVLSDFMHGVFTECEKGKAYYNFAVGVGL